MTEYPHLPKRYIFRLESSTLLLKLNSKSIYMYGFLGSKCTPEVNCEYLSIYCIKSTKQGH